MCLQSVSPVNFLSVLPLGSVVVVKPLSQSSASSDLCAPHLGWRGVGGGQWDERALMVSFYLLAKLGDTQELEEFIADLDKVLEGMYVVLSTRLSHRYGTACDISVVSAELAVL